VCKKWSTYGEYARIVCAGNTAIVDNGMPAPQGAPVTKYAAVVAEAATGCLQKVVVFAVVTPMVTGTLSGRPASGNCLNSREGNLRGSNVAHPVDKPAFPMVRQPRVLVHQLR